MPLTRRAFARQALTVTALAAAPTRLRADALLADDLGPTGWTGHNSLKAHASALGLLAGAAVNVPLLARDAAYRQALIDQYNIVVAENSMKWAGLRPAPDQFFWDEADAFVHFAQDHGMAIRGHNLCWHEALPAWFAGTVNSGNAEQYLTTHIRTVMDRYKGKIRAWDVVNEAIDPKDGKPEGLRNSPWYQLLGPRYLEIAFRTARAADPHALLTYNDYGIETDGPADTAKREAVARLVERLCEAGAPIDAVGVQSHLSADSAGQIGDGLNRFLGRMQSLGLRIFITEMDVNDDSLAEADPQARARAVDAIYTDYVSRALRNPAVTDVLTWGTANRWSWLNAKTPGAAKFRPKHPDREELCLPFDDNYRPLPAFYGLRAALDTRDI